MSVNNPIQLRILFTILFFVSAVSVLLFFWIAHVIAFTGFLLIIWLCSWSLSRYFVEYKYLDHDIVSSDNKAVFITGCDSGFGKHCAIKLSNLGYHVFACCLNKDTNGYNELLELSKTSKGKIDLVLLDVTSDESINAAYFFVTKNLDDNEKLWAVVNNAGLGGYHGFNWMNKPIEFYQKLINVNVHGVVRVTQKFTPLLLDSPNSRFVFLSSYAGRLSFSGMVAYNMTKHSVRVFANCVRKELNHLNIKTIIIEPTMYKTEMTNCESSLKMFDESWESTDKLLKDKIGYSVYHEMRDDLIALMDTTRSEIDEVVSTIVKAVKLRNPYPFYKVSNLVQRIVLYFTEYLPEEVHDIVLTGNFHRKIMKIFKLSNQN